MPPLACRAPWLSVEPLPPRRRRYFIQEPATEAVALMLPGPPIRSSPSIRKTSSRAAARRSPFLAYFEAFENVTTSGARVEAGNFQSAICE
ncbi:MAG: hypothetical protein ACRD3T_05905 [Terriglobia bacterium]